MSVLKLDVAMRTDRGVVRQSNEDAVGGDPAAGLVVLADGMGGANAGEVASGQIRGRVSIDERPAIVNAKQRIGDWEIDTIIGKNHKGVLLTAVERKSKFTLIKKLANKKADRMANATVNLLGPYQKKVFTITSDNGKEFANHDRIAKELKTGFYFAHPYHAWERGLNENTNGLIRQYFPKKSSFDNITDDQVQMVMNRLNNRPRKTLGFATPIEMFFNLSHKKAA